MVIYFEKNPDKLVTIVVDSTERFPTTGAFYVQIGTEIVKCSGLDGSNPDTKITAASATDGEGRINFGDSGDNDIGFLRYNHDNGRMWMINNGGDTNYAFGLDCNVTTTTKFRLQIFSDGAENSRHRMIGFDNSSQGRGYIEISSASLVTR